MPCVLAGHDTRSNRPCYLAAKSTGESFFSTFDIQKAREWHSPDAARSWAESLPGERFDRLAARFPAIVGDEIHWLDDPLDWIDGREISADDLRRLAEDFPAEVEVAAVADRPKAVRRATMFGEGG
jgi:peptidoglycan/xylan/chitin deacetylase (PgdA/CDA1 family)